MKKLLLLCMLTLESISYSSPNCLGYNMRPRFRKGPLEKVECNCPCQNYSKAGHVDGYKCLNCSHALIPEEIKKQENNEKILAEHTATLLKNIKALQSQK